MGVVRSAASYFLASLSLQGEACFSSCQPFPEPSGMTGSQVLIPLLKSRANAGQGHCGGHAVEAGAGLDPKRNPFPVSEVGKSVEQGHCLNLHLCCPLPERSDSESQEEVIQNIARHLALVGDEMDRSIHPSLVNNLAAQFMNRSLLEEVSEGQQLPAPLIPSAQPL